MSEVLHLIAHVGDRGIAIPADTVDSVVDIAEIVPAPRSHPAVRGLAALRSKVVTVIDTWQVLGLASRPDDAKRAILAVVDGHPHAMLVDSLEDVAPLQVDPIPSGLALGQRWSEVSTGVADRSGQTLLVVDLSKLVGLLVAVD